MSPRLLAYVELGRIQFRTALTYRADYLINFVGILVMVYLLRVVWTAVYDGRATVDGVPLATIIAYSTLAVVQYALFNPWNFSQIPQRVREGKVAVDLLRPVGFVSQAFAGQAGVTVALLPLMVLIMPLAILLGGMAPPAGASAVFGYVASLTLGYVISAQIAVVVGCLAFWTTELTGIFIIFRTTSQFLSGAMVPLWVMPDWLATVAQLLPFQATAYTPTAIYLGRLTGTDMAVAVAVQAAWIAVVALIARLVWSRAVRRVVVQGG